jgi:16S rRNA (guanine527-N7)-methyltransferase
MVEAPAPLHLLTEGAAQLGVKLSREATLQFSTYLEELLLWSPKIDLISQTAPVEVIRKHILDSLAVVPYISTQARVLDLGSGAGFPGIPIALSRPQARVDLLEIRRKRVNFLRQVARKIPLLNLRIHEGRAEALAHEKDLQKAFNVIITRATWNIETFLHYASPFLQTTGIAIAMKGLRETLKQGFGETSIKDCAFRLQESHSYQLPFGREKRQLFIFAHNVSRDT